MFPALTFVCPERYSPAMGKTSASGYVDDSSKLLVPGRVTAATTILEGSMTTPIRPAELLGSPDVIQLTAGINRFGILDLENGSKHVWCKEVHWTRAIRLSNDCHSYNIQLRLQQRSKKAPAPKLILQAMKTIEPGQELMLWFSEDILAMLQIAFLTPANIQGQKKYICTKCSTMYESPNPLKLHITLGCGRFSTITLWERLSDMLSDRKFLEKPAQEFEFKLQPQHATSVQKNAMDLSTSMQQSVGVTPAIFSSLYRPYSESSAFKPFQKPGDNNPLKLPDPLNNDLQRVVQNWQMLPYQGNAQQGNDEAQIETLVSSLGKSKDGHVCLYCGKCYSRKYGLKIHIRTHTGYKPLKCKFCLRPFGDPSNLNKHVRLHAEGETPYKCELCGKILVRRRDLERHLKSRHISDMYPDGAISAEAFEDSQATSEEDSKKNIDLIYTS